MDFQLPELWKKLRSEGIVSEKCQGSSDSDAPHEWKQDHSFPLTQEVANLLRERQDPLADFAEMTSGEIITVLRKRFVFVDHPFLSEFAAALLGTRLSHLTLMRDFTPVSTRETSYPGSTSSYLSFSEGSNEFHLPAGRPVSRHFRELYPFENVPGLLEFFENFGGMVVGRVPPGSSFESCAHELLVDSQDPGREWGEVGEWEGSLVWYSGGTGDKIIFHKDGTAGVWCHDATDGEQTWPVGMNFPELLGGLQKFILEEPGEDNPFYY